MPLSSVTRSRLETLATILYHLPDDTEEGMRFLGSSTF